MKFLDSIKLLLVALICFTGTTAICAAADVPVAIFPLQELGDGRYDANLPFTRLLAEDLRTSGAEIIPTDVVIAFMANNRIRTLGYLESFDIFRVRHDLRSPFVLLGTVTQRKDRPEPSMGLTLHLVRTSDSRTVWTYAGSFSTGEERTIMGIGEPRTTADLQQLFLDEVRDRWPWRLIEEEQLVGSISIDTVVLQPEVVRPGDEVTCRVRLREDQINGPGLDKQIFFQVGDQLYPATVSEDGRIYQGTWVATEEDGRYQVTLLREWPQYQRTEKTLLGDYIVDGTVPQFDMELIGNTEIDGVPVFWNKLRGRLRSIVRKPLERWNISIYYDQPPMKGDFIGETAGKGNLPETFTWAGQDNVGDGLYKIIFKVWDRAGNTAEVVKRAKLNRASAQVNLSLRSENEKNTVDIVSAGKIPLKYWRLEMWTEEGKILAQEEGEQLPVSVDVDLANAGLDQKVRGFLFYQDSMGRTSRRQVENLLPKLDGEEQAKEDGATGIGKDWVDEF